MKNVLISLVCVLVVAAIWLTVEVVYVVRALNNFPERVLVMVDQRAAGLGDKLDARLASVESKLDSRISILTTESLKRIDVLSARVDGHLSDVVDVVDVRTGELTKSLDTTSLTLNRTIEEYGRVPGVVGQRLDPWTNCNGNGACWQAQFTASLGSARYTMGQIARAAPTIAESVKVTTLAAQQTAQSAALTAQNASQLTKPGPRWMRYVGLGLSVAVPASQIAMPFALRGATSR